MAKNVQTILFLIIIYLKDLNHTLFNFTNYLQFIYLPFTINIVFICTNSAVKFSNFVYNLDNQSNFNALSGQKIDPVI